MGTHSASPSSSTSFGDYEASVESSVPQEVVDFACGSTHWRMTSSATAITYAGVTYAAQAGLKVGHLEISRNALRNRLEITLPWSASIVRTWRTSPPDARVTVVVYRGQSGIWRRWFAGFVQILEWGEERKATLRCVAASNDLGMGSMALRCGRMCQVSVYSAACGLVESDHRTSGTVQSVSGAVVTGTAADIGSLTDGWWVGGRFTAGGYTRIVLSHTGNSVVLNSSIPSLTAGAGFTVSAGCDHLIDTCDTKFANMVNFRGQPDMPDTNVFKTGVI